MSGDQTAVDGPVAVIGCGLIGTSVALALVRAGVDVLLDDADPTHRAIAVERTGGKPLASEDQPSIVVVAVPPSAAAQAIASASITYSNATITDVTSVKVQILEQAHVLGADCSRLVGGHPLAGRELSGPNAARNDVFDDRIWVITPCEDAGIDHIGRVRELVATCGAVAIDMSAAEHDEAVALTSHAPQVVSSALAARLANVDPRLVRVSGTGLKDMTRIASSDPALWTDILAANSEPVVDVIEALIAELQTVATDLRHGGQQASVTELIERGNTGAKKVPGKHGGAATAYEVVPVMVRDEPGELARLFVAAGEAQINLEDVRIEHVLGKPSGLIELSVRPSVTQSLIEALRTRGFDVRA